MITVSFSYENGVRELVCSGHAGYDPGNDVVCAAASAITGALAAVLLKREELLAPSEEGAVEGGGTPSETEGEITQPAAATPHPNVNAGYAGSPQGEGLTDAQRKAGESAVGNDNPSVACGDSSPYTGEPICLAGARREMSACADAKYSLARMRNVGLRRRDMFAFGERCAACGGDNPSVSFAGSSPYTGEPGGVSVSEGAGYCRIACAGDAAKPYFEFALVGLKKLAEAFPENVRVVGGE